VLRSSLRENGVKANNEFPRIWKEAVVAKFFFNFLGMGETESSWYVGHYWPIVPAPDNDG
jgi:hypothetical protein